MRLLLIAVAATLAAAAPAAAGGWANVQLSQLPPETPVSGQKWTVDLDIKQHGVTPLVGAKPAVLLRGADGATHRFAGRPTAKPGVYRATVVFPAGRWQMDVDDGFTNAVKHSYPTVDVGPATAPAPATTGGGGDRTLLLGGAILAALGLATAAALITRRRRPIPA